jgi:hypothetical protein
MAASGSKSDQGNGRLVIAQKIRRKPNMMQLPPQRHREPAAVDHLVLPLAQSLGALAK